MEKLLDTYIVNQVLCRDCGSMVVGQANNTDLMLFAEWDWFWYCANKGCDNHIGTGVFQEDPDWVVSE